MGFVRSSNISKALNIVVKFCCKILYNIKPDWNVELKHINIVMALNTKTVCDLGWVLFFFICTMIRSLFWWGYQFCPKLFQVPNKEPSFLFSFKFSQFETFITIDIITRFVIFLCLQLWIISLIQIIIKLSTVSGNFPECLETF